MNYSQRSEVVPGIVYDKKLTLELSTIECVIISSQLKEAVAHEEDPNKLKALRDLGELLFNHSINDDNIIIEKKIEQVTA